MYYLFMNFPAKEGNYSFNLSHINRIALFHDIHLAWKIKGVDFFKGE